MQVRRNDTGVEARDVWTPGGSDSIIQIRFSQGRARLPAVSPRGRYHVRGEAGLDVRADRACRQCCPHCGQRARPRLRRVILRRGGVAHCGRCVRVCAGRSVGRAGGRELSQGFLVVLSIE